MAVGKSSLGRVAQSGVRAEVAATLVTAVQTDKAAEQAKRAKEQEGKTAKKASAPAASKTPAAQTQKGAGKKLQARKIYAVGDPLPVHLL